MRPRRFSKRAIPSFSSMPPHHIVVVKSFDDRSLAGDDPGHGLVTPKPRTPVDLGKHLERARLGRPYHGEAFAHQFCRVTIAFQGPYRQLLAAGLGEAPQRPKIPVGRKTRLFAKFPLCRGKKILLTIGNAFGDGPGALVLIRPIGSARMNQKDFGPSSGPAVEQNPGTVN